MSKKTCKDCLHCYIDSAYEVYCSGMPWYYPSSDNYPVALDKKACEYFLERVKPTLFDAITESPYVLAEELVTLDCDGWWAYVGIGKRESYPTREQAVAVTVEKLMKVLESTVIPKAPTKGSEEDNE